MTTNILQQGEEFNIKITNEIIKTNISQKNLSWLSQNKCCLIAKDLIDGLMTKDEEIIKLICSTLYSIKQIDYDDLLSYEKLDNTFTISNNKLIIGYENEINKNKFLKDKLRTTVFMTSDTFQYFLDENINILDRIVEVKNYELLFDIFKNYDNLLLDEDYINILNILKFQKKNRSIDYNFMRKILSLRRVQRNVKNVCEFSRSISYHTINNLKQCETFVNDTDMLLRPWKDVLTDTTENNIIYTVYTLDNNKKIIRYGFVIEQLLKDWKNRILNYDSQEGIFTPSYPVNFYTNDPLRPHIVYEIAIIAKLNGIFIPNCVRMLLCYPEIIERTYLNCRRGKSKHDISFDFLSQLYNKGFNFYFDSSNDKVSVTCEKSSLLLEELTMYYQLCKLNFK